MTAAHHAVGMRRTVSLLLVLALGVTSWLLAGREEAPIDVEPAVGEPTDGEAPVSLRVAGSAEGEGKQGPSFGHLPAQASAGSDRLAKARAHLATLDERAARPTAKVP